MNDADRARAEVLRTKDFVGWAVTSSNGANVGTVADILIDRKGQVRFLAIDPGFFKKPVLLPVEALEWGEGSLVASWTDAEIRALPPYEPNVPITSHVLEELEGGFPRFYTRGGGPLPLADLGDRPQIVPLRDAKDFRLAKGAPNLRGWDVYSADHEKVGKVHEMLVDPVAMKIRYLDVDLADDLFALTDDRHVLVPLEAVELRDRSQDAVVNGIAARDMARLPAYLGGRVDPMIEDAVERAFRGGGSSPAIGAGDATAALPPFVTAGGDANSLPPGDLDARGLPPGDAPPPVPPTAVIDRGDQPPIEVVDDPELRERSDES